MVIKISAWGHKLASKAAAMGKYTPDMFVKSQWQRTRDISIYYLVYRCVVACLFLAVLIFSIADPGSEESGLTDTGSPAFYAKWLIYLTHWGFTLCTVQAVMGAVLVAKERYLNTDKETEAMKMRHSLRAYWVLFNCAVCSALAITAIYWLFVFVPGVTPVDFLNLCVHAGNSIFMLLDLMIVAFPLRLIDFYCPLIFGVLYAIFNGIYYLAGGTDRKGNRYIYTIQDWSKPGKALLVVVMSMVFLMILHVLMCGATVGRRKLSDRWRRRQTDITDTRTRSMEGATNEIPINDLV